jgi:hypothetical protein
MKRALWLAFVLLSFVPVFGKNFTGIYTCNGKGLVDEIEFRSSTRVVVIVVGSRFPTTYTVEDGFLYIKHDKGGDFSFRIEPDGTLTGDDMWSKKAVCTKKR